MENAQEVLIILLSSVLIIFLIVNIILFVFAIKLVNSIRRISAKAEALTDKAEAVGEFMQHAAVPVLIGKVLASFSDIFRSSKSKRK